MSTDPETIELDEEFLKLCEAEGAKSIIDEELPIRLSPDILSKKPMSRRRATAAKGKGKKSVDFEPEPTPPEVAEVAEVQEVPEDVKKVEEPEEEPVYINNNKSICDWGSDTDEASTDQEITNLEIMKPTFYIPHPSSTVKEEELREELRNVKFKSFIAGWGFGTTCVSLCYILWSTILSR